MLTTKDLLPRGFEFACLFLFPIDGSCTRWLLASNGETSAVMTSLRYKFYICLHLFISFLVSFLFSFLFSLLHPLFGRYIVHLFIVRLTGLGFIRLRFKVVQVLLPQHQASSRSIKLYLKCFGVLNQRLIYFLSTMAFYTGIFRVTPPALNHLNAWSHLTTIRHDFPAQLNMKLEVLRTLDISLAQHDQTHQTRQSIGIPKKHHCFLSISADHKHPFVESYPAYLAYFYYVNRKTRKTQSISINYPLDEFKLCRVALQNHARLTDISWAGGFFAYRSCNLTLKTSTWHQVNLGKQRGCLTQACWGYETPQEDWDREFKTNKMIVSDIFWHDPNTSFGGFLTPSFLQETMGNWENCSPLG